MYKIGIIGSKDYIRESNVAKFVKKIYDQFGRTATILSGGGDQGAERWVKKYTLEFSMNYKEYNPSFTGHRMYSAMDESYYGKGFHPSHFHDRYKHLIFEAERLVIFVEKTTKLEPDLEFAIKQAQKKNIPFIIVN